LGRILAYVTGTVDQELLAWNEYLAAENRILKVQLNGRLKLSDAERAVLGEIGPRLGRQVLADIATIARPDTILGWYRKLVARKFDGSKASRIKREAEQLIIRMASENREWGYDRIAGRWPIWGTGFPIKQLAMCCDVTVCRRRRSASARPLAGPCSNPSGAAGGDRLLHRRGADAARATCCSSSTSRAAGYTSPGSPFTRMRRG
jgi:hypothetical protein